MSFTFTKNHQVPWYEFPKVERQLKCSSQSFVVMQKIETVTEICERFVTDFWFVNKAPNHSQTIVGFIAPKDVVSFKMFCTAEITAFKMPEQTFDKINWIRENLNKKLQSFSIAFLRRLEGYATKRKEKTVKFKFDIFTLAQVQAAITSKSEQEIKWMEEQHPELDKITTRRLLQAYRKNRDPVVVHPIGDVSRAVIKQTLNTREHVEGNKPGWQYHGRW